MNLHLKKIISIISVAAILLTCFCGCGSKSDDKKVTLKWIIQGPGVLKDSEEVWAEFNKELENYMPGVKVDFEVIPPAEYAEKWGYIASSGEKVDLAWVGYMQDYLSEVRKGAYYALDDLLETPTGKELKEEIPDWAFSLQKVGGKIYSVPCMQMLVTIPKGFCIPKDLYDEFMGDENAKKLEAIFTSGKPIEAGDYAIIEEFLQKCKDSGKLGKGISPNLVQWILPARYGHTQFEQTIIGPNCDYVNNNDETLTFHNGKDLISKKNESYDIMNDWFKKGYIRQDIMGLDSYTADVGVKNGYCIWDCENLEGSEESYSKKYGMEVKIIPFENKGFIDARAVNTATAVSANSTNPEKAFELLTLMNTKKGADLLNLLSFGIEGKHYKKTGDMTIELTGPANTGSSENDYGYSDWSLGNTFYTYNTQYQTADYGEYSKRLNEEAIKSPLLGFTFDTSPVEVEWSQCKAVESEYSYLNYGGVGTVNYKKVVAERDEKMKLAGIEKISAEIKRQIEEWKKTNK